MINGTRVTTTKDLPFARAGSKGEVVTGGPLLTVNLDGRDGLFLVDKANLKARR